MRRTITVALILVAGLAACSEANREIEVDASAQMAEAAPAAPPMSERKVAAADAMAVAGGAAAQPAPSVNPATPPGLGAPMLAYAYQVGLEAPARNVRALMVSHERACILAGPARCQVIGGATSSEGDDVVSANLSLRAEPAWLATFREGLDADVRKSGGKITSRNVMSEDLTRQIVDTDARVRAQKALRTRLEALIANRPGKLAELLEIERELARVQGEIDSAESNLAVMRARVAMSTLDLSYRSEGAPVVTGTFSPLRNAIDGFVGTVAGGFAAIITLIAVLLPWLIVLGPAGWFGGRWLARRRTAKAAAKAATPAP